MHHQGETEIDELREQRRRVGHERHGEQEGEADPGEVAVATREVAELRLLAVPEDAEDGKAHEVGQRRGGWEHKSMRQERETNNPPGGKWVASTPAQAAGLTDHHWPVEELLSFCVPPAERPKWRGRRPKWLMEAARVA